MLQIPIYKPDLSGNEKKYVNACLDSTWISSKGEFINKFESAFCNYTSSNFSIGVCNGTVALHLALLALDIGNGDEVIVPTLTYIASVNAIHYVGATPIFAESDPNTWQIDIHHVKSLITSKTKAIMAVHLYGGACNIAELKELCELHNLKLIEDCAEALGTFINGQHVGIVGDIGTFSFFGNKTISTGEGGMVTCSDAKINLKIRHLRGQGLADNREYWHDIVGYNYRLTNICAAIGLAQIERVDEILLKKRILAERYINALKGLPYTFQQFMPNVQASLWMVTILTESAETRDRLRAHLAKNGIETRPTFFPAHTMPMYIKEGVSLPIAADIGSRGINLPSWHNLSDTEFDYIIETIKCFS